MTKKISIIIVFTLALSSFKSCNYEDFKIDFNAQSDTYFSELDKSAKEEIYIAAEQDAGEMLAQDISQRFNINNIACKVTINRDTFLIEILEIHLNGASVSTAEIKRFVKEKYDVTEVIIN